MVKVALLIGVSDYAPGLNPLPAAVKDVAALQRIFQDSEMGGFDEVKVLTNPDPQSMQYEIETLFTGRAKDDLVLLFFSGHGIKDDSNNLYFATRITQKNLKGDLIRSTAVPARFIHEVMNNSRAKRQAIILDCCFSGAFDPTLQTKDDGSVDLQGQLGSEGRVVLTSSSSTQYSFEQQGSELSLYTRYLVEGIETGAGDRDEDGRISIRELHDYATSKVQEAAPNMTPKLITLKEMGFDIVLAKAKITDPQLRYRRQVERYSSRGNISAIGRTILDQLQTQLGLSPDIARGIEAEVLLPYQKRLENLQRYRQVFSEAVGQEYPLSSHAQSELGDLREVLGLRPEDVDSIEQEIVAQIVQKSNFEQASDQQTPEQHEQEVATESILDQPIKQPILEQQEKDQLNFPSENNQIVNSLDLNRSKKVVVTAISSILALMAGSILVFNKSLFPGNESSNNNEVKTYTIGELTITGDRQHVCNVLLPRGPGLGRTFSDASEEALWKSLECENLYCNLSDANCRASLSSQGANPDQSSSATPVVQPTDSTELILIDQIIEFPNQPLAASAASYYLDSLTPEQARALNDLFNRFNQVDSASKPAAPGSSTSYEGWNALCLGEQGQFGCPQSAIHEVVSYGQINLAKSLWVSRGWVFYKP